MVCFEYILAVKTHTKVFFTMRTYDVTPPNMDNLYKLLIEII